MKLGIKKISHISLSTNNLKKTINFYKNILGFKIVHRFKNKNNKLYGVFFLIGKGTFLEIFNSYKKLKISEPFRHICFEVEDLNLFKKKIKKFIFNTCISRGGTVKTLTCKIFDPNGIEIELCQIDKKSKLYPYRK